LTGRFELNAEVDSSMRLYLMQHGEAVAAAAARPAAQSWFWFQLPAAGKEGEILRCLVLTVD